jgi:hypothetical protein
VAAKSVICLLVVQTSIHQLKNFWQAWHLACKNEVWYFLSFLRFLTFRIRPLQTSLTCLQRPEVQLVPEGHYWGLVGLPSFARDFYCQLCLCLFVSMLLCRFVSMSLCIPVSSLYLSQTLPNLKYAYLLTCPHAPLSLSLSLSLFR